MGKRTRLLANAALFQIAWFACVFGAQRPLLLLVALACTAAHGLWLSQPGEWRLWLITASCGWVLDSALLQLDVLRFAGDSPVLPLWLALLWLAFATTLRHSLAWTARPWWLGSLLGTVGGPLSYWGGARLADVEMPLGTPASLLVLAVVWAILLPALHALASRLR